MILVIDNYDSFTYNLVQYLGELGAEVHVVRNDVATVEEVASTRPERIVISPGPGRPEDAGITMEVIRRLGETVPLLGVCLGHQAIGAVFGGTVDRAPRADARQDVDDRAQRPRRLHTASARPFAASRYHSLVVADEGLPGELEVTARTREDGTIMGLRHRDVADSRRAVPSRVDSHGRRPSHPSQLPRGAARLTCFPH